ncbi:MAG: alpha-ketoglutarate-dependent dioxygenase AlkB [Actinobacteria bacterium]|nr:alpha-ketoglutarate-dependent dioxygenase AlkB [Actinomycetota bacterium]
MDALPGTSLVEAPVVERIDLGRGSWVDVVRGLLSDGDAVHDDLVQDVSWQQGRVFRYERWIDEPRLGGWQAGSDLHPVLADVSRWLARRYRVAFDGVALARYRHAADSVGFHRDREMRWLEDTVVGVLTLGATRSFLMRPIDERRSSHDDLVDGSGRTFDLAPAGGDLLVMGGRCQADWLHAVPKVRGGPVVGDRISAQYRWTSRRGRPDIQPGYRAPRFYSR